MKMSISFIKRFVVFLCIALFLLPICASGENSKTSSNPLQYFTSIEMPDDIKGLICGVRNGKVTVFRYTGGIAHVTIPEQINGYPVTAIAKYAFSKRSSPSNLTIPNSVTSIGEGAFNECINLTSIVIPNSVTSIGDYAFNECPRLTSIVIPNSVTSIGDYAFNGCTNLTSIIIPDRVTSIGNRAFYECTNLTSINIPESVTSIGEDAFWQCFRLETVDMKKDSYAHKWWLENHSYYKDRIRTY